MYKQGEAVEGIVLEVPVAVGVGTYLAIMSSTLQVMGQAVNLG